MGNRSVFRVAVDFEQVDACIEASRACAELTSQSGADRSEVAGRYTRAWQEALSSQVSRTILDHAKVEPTDLSSLITSGLLGKDLPQDKTGFLARKALGSGQPRFAQFVEEARSVADTVADTAAQAASAYLPVCLPGSPIPVTVRFAGFALADSFSPPGGPVINLGDMFFLVHEKIIGDPGELKLQKTLRLIRRVIAHELHHVGLGRLISFPETPNEEWLLKFIISEGVATALMLPFTEDDAYYHERWAQHSGRLDRYVWELSDALAESQERIPPDVWEKWVMNVGAAYYVGASMTQAIDQAFGRERLLEAITGVPSFFKLYNSAATKWRLPVLINVHDWADGKGQ